jgi:hypothetical protein
MASKNFPGPNINRLIDTDPQIVKVPMDYFQWGARASNMPKGTDPKSDKPGQAPGSNSEMTIKHTS